jgi:energy-coupling factor transporter ATP-binding protein EcfA2
MDKIDEINTFDKRTIIMVSHNAAHLSYAHRVYYLKDGFIVREVVNPQRKQIKPVKEGETIVTELEQLARLFPYDSVETLRVKSLVNLVTQDYTFDQLERIEAIITHFLAGKVDASATIKVLVASYERGGVGLEEKDAKRMVHVAGKIIENADDIRRFRKHQGDDHAFFGQAKLAERLRDHLMQQHRLKLSKKQDTNLVELISDRVVGVIGDDAFNEQLMRGVTVGGLALSEKEADDLTRYFEKIIALGVDVNYKS